jgi:two-component system NtrC family sensor kinase
MQPGNSTAIQGSAAPSEDAFQKLLLSISSASALGVAADALIQSFCRATRQFFQVSGVYQWKLVSATELVGTEADGHMADRFRGCEMSIDQNAVAVEAIRSRRTTFINHVDKVGYQLAQEFGAKSILAAPLVVFGEVIGATVLLHTSDPEFFTPDLAAKATILASQLGSVLEANRLSLVSREEQRRAEILLECAQALHAVPDAGAVIETLADRLRQSLRARAVCVLLRQEGEFRLRAVAAETPELGRTVRSRHDGSGLLYAAELASRAIAAGEPTTIPLGASSPLADLAPAGVLFAAPVRTSRTAGAILLYPGKETVFTPQEKSLIAAVAGFGSVAIANAELYAMASAQAQELHQLLEIAGELASIADLDQFLQKFVVRAAGFLGFRRSFIALLEGSRCQLRWLADDHGVRSLTAHCSVDQARPVLVDKQVFWTDDIAQLPQARGNPELAQQNVHQVLAVPLSGFDGRVLGMFGVLDQSDGQPISREDIRRAQALAAQVCVALEIASNLKASEQHRRRAQDLTTLALELSLQLRVPEFTRKFVARVADMMGARSVVLALAQGAPGETGWHDSASIPDRRMEQRLQSAVTDAVRERNETVISGSAAELLGAALAEALAWKEVTLLRLQAGDGELLGALCLSGRDRPLTAEDQQLLAALVGHASVALQNARLFTRMDQANRHWLEIFDAISDFIVVHDAAGNVLRINRPLADFIGVRPQELIGVNMRAVVAMATQTAPASCPFCRMGSDGSDESLHVFLERTYLVSTSRIHGANGQEGLQTIHVMKDITDRREAERRYRELFDNIQEGLFFCTPDGRFIEVNDALVRMLGYESREELLQSDIHTQLYFSPEQRQHFLSLLDQHGMLRNHEETLRRKDGAPIHALQNVFAVRDSQGRMLQYRGLMMDVTGLKSFQVELQRERDFSSKILNHTQSLILVTDTAGQISYGNRRWAEAGYRLEQLVGRPIEEMVAPSRQAHLREAVQATINGHQVDNLELPIVRGDGRLGQFSVNLSPMRDEQGAVTNIVVVMTDITDAAMLQAKLRHAEKMAAVGQLVSGVAHEVNNPLTAILGFADLMMDNPELAESARKDLRVILQEAQRTKQIVQNLLSFARQMPPQRNPLQLNAILRRTVQLRAYDFHSHGVEVVELLDEHLPDVIGDSHQLQQVFLNILNNAYDAVRETGRPARIEISTSGSRTYAEVSFRDNGNGILEPERIFDPFFTTKEVGKGTGLGLSICYGIVREHGGEILCHNNLGGPGATFIVRLPLAVERVEGTAGGAS